MAMQTYKAGSKYTFVDSASVASLTLTLPTIAADLQWVIDAIWLNAVGTPTAPHNLQVFKNDGVTLIAIIGGQTSGVTAAWNDLRGPICTTSGDAPKVLYTATSCTFVGITVFAHVENA